MPTNQTEYALDKGKSEIVQLLVTNMPSLSLSNMTNQCKMLEQRRTEIQLGRYRLKIFCHQDKKGSKRGVEGQLKEREIGAVQSNADQQKETGRDENEPCGHRVNCEAARRRFGAEQRRQGD
jgi:hypothetical protein